METINAYGYYFTNSGAPLEKKSFTIDNVDDNNIVVKVAGCGLCHTDLGFIAGHVKTNVELPLILGHEISGEVIAAGDSFKGLSGKKIIIPAVIPCGNCEFCNSGRSNVCRSQKMPGNDFNGGFASHITVPGRFICELPESLGELNLSNLAVVADAVTTPYQSLMRSNLKKNDLAIVIGVGGIGIYMVQFANDAGATVIAMDIDDKKLESAKKLGASFTINSKGRSEKDIKSSIRGLVKENGLPKNMWKVFETSGTAMGQGTAFSLLSFGGTVGIVGFTMDKITIRLSNVMAFDADLFGNWGCMPEYYPPAVEKVLNGRINILNNIEEHPLDSINDVIEKATAHKLNRRAILIP